MRDVRELRDLLLGEHGWDRALREYATRRTAYYSVLREYARWFAVLEHEEGPDAEARRARAARARESDPSAGGFHDVFGRGPDGLVADEATRRRFFGEA